MFSSGTFPVLTLFSSNIFGLNIFQSGLLSSELRELSKIKIKSTIYMENAPQILIQLFFLQIDGFQEETLLALIASALSIVSTLMIYYGERDLRSQFDVTTYFIRLRSANAVLDSEKAAMSSRQKLRKALKLKLAAALGIAEKQIEIGNTTLRESGLMVHIQHLIFSNELDAFKRKRNLYDVSTETYVNAVFQKRMKHIFEAMCSHFQISPLQQRHYMVSYQAELVAHSTSPSEHADVEMDFDDSRVRTSRRSGPSFSYSGDGLKTNNHFGKVTAGAHIKLPSLSPSQDALPEDLHEMEMVTVSGGRRSRATPGVAGGTDIDQILSTVRKEMDVRNQQMQQHLEDKLANQLEQISAMMLHHGGDGKTKQRE